MVTNGCDYFFPLVDERSRPTIGIVIKQSELSAVTPDSQLVDGFSDGNFTLSLLCQVLEFSRFLEHRWHRVSQVAELHIVNSDLFRHAKEVDKASPMLFFERLACAQLDDRPSLLKFFDLSLQEASDNSLVRASLNLICPL